MPSSRSAVAGALVVMRVLMMLASWSTTTMPMLQPATEPIVRRPMPEMPHFGR